MPILTYGLETWALRKVDEKRIEAVKMRFIRRTSGIILSDRVRSENMRNNLKSNAGDEANQELQKKVEGTRGKPSIPEDGDGIYTNYEVKAGRTKKETDGHIRVIRGKYTNADRPLGLRRK